MKDYDLIDILFYSGFVIVVLGLMSIGIISALKTGC